MDHASGELSCHDITLHSLVSAAIGLQHLALWGVYYRNYVYRHVTGWNDFEPGLSLAEQVEAHQLWQCGCDMPKKQQHERNPFPNWWHTPQVAVPALPADALECRA